MINLKKIQTQFLDEARSAPTLFADLAKVELYISESYRTRAFAELLQNADDAKSTNFVAIYYNEKLFVGNNGDLFTEEDLTALCRSGSSNKKRDGNTIGYRGIGFKSVAGIAEKICVISGDLIFKFCKKDTQNILNVNHDVPLIRIPHSMDENDPLVHLAKRMQKNKQMTTVFVMSGLNIRILEEEINGFDENSILFVNTVRSMDIDLPNLKRNIVRNGIQQNDVDLETISSESSTSTWMVVGQESACEKVAFKYEDETITACSAEDALIHAFLPTSEFSGAFLKFNGNFSTDPSRKNVDFDDLSRHSFKTCSSLLASAIDKAITEKTLKGIFSTLISNSPIQGRFRKLLRDELITLFEQDGVALSNHNRVKPSDIRLAPKWLNYADYEDLCHNIPYLSKKLINSHPNSIKFFEWIGAKQLSVLEVIERIDNTPLSAIGYAQIMSKFASQFRFDMDNKRTSIISSALILPTKIGIITTKNYKNEELDPEFLDYLNHLPDKDDMIFLFNHLNLKEVFKKKNKKAPSTIRNEIKETPKSAGSTFKHLPEIKKWRSAELNAVNWFSALSNVADVRDVSKANVGYDLDVLLNDGQRYQVEVKSVGSFSEPFILTNHEHATAFQSGDFYLLAIVINSDPFEIKIIQNPVRTIELEKRCKQWIWACENYSSQFVDLFNIEGMN